MRQSWYSTAGTNFTKPWAHIPCRTLSACHSFFQVILSLGLAGPFLSLAAVRRTGKKILLLVSTAAMTAAALFLALLSHFEVSGKN